MVVLHKFTSFIHHSGFFFSFFFWFLFWFRFVTTLLMLLADLIIDNVVPSTYSLQRENTKIRPLNLTTTEFFFLFFFTFCCLSQYTVQCTVQNEEIGRIDGCCELLSSFFWWIFACENRKRQSSVLPKNKTSNNEKCVVTRIAFGSHSNRSFVHLVCVCVCAMRKQDVGLIVFNVMMEWWMSFSPYSIPEKIHIKICKFISAIEKLSGTQWTLCR